MIKTLTLLNPNLSNIYTIESIILGWNKFFSMVFGYKDYYNQFQKNIFGTVTKYKKTFQLLMMKKILTIIMNESKL